MDLIQQYNKYGATKKLITKALNSATGVGEALIPQHLEQIITNTIVRLSPELAMLTPKYDAQKLHEFNRLTTLPKQGGAMGEGATTPTRNAVFARANVTLKVIRRKGAVTNFLQDASANAYDASAVEMESHLTSHVYDLINYTLYGNAASNQYEYSGLDHFVLTNRGNQAVGGGVPTDLTFLDNMIDKNLGKQGTKHAKAFLMSPQMLSKVSRLLTNVRLNQGLAAGGMSQVDINGGWRLNAYRDIPIIVSSACRPKETMGTVTPSTAATGGTIPDDTYYFRISKVTYNGESISCDEISQITAGGGLSTVTLTFAAQTDALKFKIYCSDATGTEVLVRVIPNATYDANGTFTVSSAMSITNGTINSDANGDITSIVLTTNPTTALAAEVPTGMQSDVPFTTDISAGANPEEYIFLWDLDEFQGIGRMPYTNRGGARFNGLVTIEQLARTDDDIPFLIKSYCALADSFEQTCVIERGYKVS